jgi:hypothetical protein
MQSPRPKRRRHRAVVAALAAFPLPVLAAERVLGAWGPYLFFAIAVTLVVVLLLHEVLEDDATSNERRREQNYRNAPPERR